MLILRLSYACAVCLCLAAAALAGGAPPAADVPAPTPEKPLKADQAEARAALKQQLEELRKAPPDQVRAHPAAAAFPGSVPADARRVERAVEIDTAVPAWHGTGLYAPAGEVVTVSAPETAAGKGLQVRIGSHTDGLWRLDSWKRCPEVCLRRPLDGGPTRVASAFGGLIYIDVPDGCPLGHVAVKIAGAVEAPCFVLGKTDPAEWRKTIRALPAPWAELATSKVVLTLPSKVVRGLDDPEDLMKFWDRALDACAELACMPLERRRPERYVADVQISAGYMHSGYPIMVLLDMPPVMVDKARMMANGHGGVWGLWHELGHNHQSPAWTFAGAGEVTVNLFTMYVFEKALGRPSGNHPEVTPESAARRTKAYLAGGANFEDWKKDPFLGLIMYIQLKDAFGWEAYRKVIAGYRALPEGERPKSEEEKRDQWMVRFSRAAGRNLGPFFQAWGVPTSDKARASIAALPAWMPEGFPPK
jgi:hypothetical protein